MIGNVNDPADWIKSVKNIKIKKEEHWKESKWRRTGGKGNTTEVVMFVITVPLNSQKDVHDILEEIF